ncbi:MAG: hypothetical protein QXH03_00860 [Candidatus Bathyarchaeia archaeon]
MVKVSINRYVYKRINNVRCELEVCATRLRKRALKNLEDIFKTAEKMAGGKIKHQRINGKMVQLTLTQRRIWLKIAQQTAETIKSLATNINEKELKTRLSIIDKLLSESIIKARSEVNTKPAT